jgi:hypothetical protein
VTAFAEWLDVINKELNTQDVEAFRNAMGQAGGALFHLNENINGNSSESLFGIISALRNDEDLSAPPAESDGAYKSRERFELAQNKLTILGYATSMYVLALKLKASYLGRLAFYGYDSTGTPIKDGSNPDTTINRIIREVPNLVATLTACGAMRCPSKKEAACHAWRANREMRGRLQQATASLGGAEPMAAW